MLPEFDNKSGQSQAEQALSRVEQLLETWREKLNKPQPSERTLVGGENPLIFRMPKDALC